MVDRSIRLGLCCGLLAIASGAAAADAVELASGGTCAAAASLSVSAARSSIPFMATPDGDCAAPGSILPIEIVAQLQDGGGLPVADCPVLFYVDFGYVDNCGRAFGEFCAEGAVAVTDANGVATVRYRLTQADLDFCNCMPTTNCAATFCPRPTCQQECSPGQDLYCQIAISAGTQRLASLNQVRIEYGR